MAWLKRGNIGDNSLERPPCGSHLLTVTPEAVGGKLHTAVLNCVPNPADTMSKREELERTFHSHGIDFSHPGFCDTPEFVKIERRDPALLNTYSQYVLEVTQGDLTYLERAREVTQSAIEYLHSELAADGTHMLCIQMSSLLTQFLNRQGVWNFGIRGSLTIRFGQGSGLDDRIFPVFEDPNVDSAHAWACVPPFRIADVSVAYQPYPPGVVERLPKYVLTADVEPASFGLEDITGPTFRATFRRQIGRAPRLADIEQNAPESFALREWHPTVLVKTPRAELLYIPFGCAASEDPLERMVAPVLRGKNPQRLYAEWVATLPAH